MPKYHLPPTATSAEVAAAIRADGFVIVDNVVSNEVMDRVAEELEEHIDLTPMGKDDFVGRMTRRTGSLIPRSAASRDLISHPLVLGTTADLLSKATVYQLHLTQVISVLPGETHQPLHRDELAWDFFPFPLDYDVQCNTIWAMTDFTEENGATRLVPGSHKFEDRLELSPEQTVPAEMPAGSVLFYTGKLYHGAGANRSNATRTGINITYAVSWVRQEENQYLSVPAEIARTLPEPLLRMMGYARGAYALGYVDDLRDPLDVLLGRKADSPSLGSLADAEARARAG